MSVTWSQLGATVTETNGDFTVTTKTYKGSGLASGYLLRVDVECVYALPLSEGGGDLPVIIGGGTSITHMTTTDPALWSWTQEAQSGTNPQHTTYIGTPLNGSSVPIGSERVYRQDMRFNDSGVGAGNHVSLTTMTP